MCLFCFPNKSSIKAKLKGIEEFECGACPECLQKKSRLWALRTCMESKVSVGCMVTLTYDTYKVGYSSKFLENNPDPTIPLSKRHCQLFMKRLRRHYPNNRIKYIITAERGKRTHRAHYHALLFGVQFDDIVRYKKSDRGNWIYKSRTLEKIWSHGIYTVDCINLSAKTARYCTKYCSKDSGAEDTFMLFSRGIGDEMLLKEFNGKSYWIEGREYPIPKQIWQKVICEKYDLYKKVKDKKTGKIKKVPFSKYAPVYKLVDHEKKIDNRYKTWSDKAYYHLRKACDNHEKHFKKLSEKRNFRKLSTYDKWRRICLKYNQKASYHKEKYQSYIVKDNFFKVQNRRLLLRELTHERGQRFNEIYQYYRDNDVLYKRYLTYWSTKAKVYDITRPTVEERISQLPDNKYWRYKQRVVVAKQSQSSNFDFIPPRSNCHGFLKFYTKKEYEEKSFAPLSCHYRANDTVKKLFREEYKELRHIRKYLMDDLPAIKEKVRKM